MKSIVYVGMDVHKASFSLCALDSTTGEILGETKCAADIKLFERFLDHLRDKVTHELTFIVGYEAGCLGYSLYHKVEKLGLECHIMAPTTMYSSTKRKQVKNDKIDAKMIVQNLANGTYSSVYVPNSMDNSVKEFIRMRCNFKRAQKKVKQQINAFVLRTGFLFSGKSKWTKKHLKWLNNLPLDRLLKLTLGEYLIQFDEYERKLDRFDQELEALSHNDQYEEPVQKLRCIKGIDTVSGTTIHVEISDFSRFPTPNAFSAYLGLTPNEHSSGDSLKKGGITKQGNTTVRTTLIECAQALVKGTIGVKSKRVNARQKGQPGAIISYADRATARLQRKFHRLTKAGKAYNVAIAAIARELACFVWGMETNNY